MTLAADTTAAAPAAPSAAIGRRVVVLAREHWVVPFTLVVSVWIAARHAMSFDGAMNLQVAQSVEAGSGYARFYGSKQYFAAEIQTNGPIILLGAALIAVFGQHNFVYQIPNVVCMVALAVVLRAIVKGPYANLLVAVCIVGLPELVQYGYNGYGELPLAMLEFAVIVLAARAVARHRERLLLAAAFLAGVAFVTKIVGIAVLIPFAVAVVWYLRDDERRRRTLLRVAGALALGPALWEVYRLVEFGSLGSWKAYWHTQISAVLFQSGASTQAPQLPIQHALWRRLGTVAGGFETGRMTVAIIIGVGVAALAAGAWRLRRDVEQRERFVVLAGLATMSIAYFVWWFFITPDERAYLRRVLIALLFVLVGLAHLLAASLAAARRDGWRTRPELAGLAVGLAMLVSGPLIHNARLISQMDTAELDTVDAAVDFVRGEGPDARFFGFDWWSAPVISAYSQTAFFDLADVDPCSLRPEGDFLVLDRYTTLLAFRTPPFDELHVVGVREYLIGQDTTIWQITAPPDCA